MVDWQRPAGQPAAAGVRHRDHQEDHRDRDGPAGTGANPGPDQPPGCWLCVSPRTPRTSRTSRRPRQARRGGSRGTSRTSRHSRAEGERWFPSEFWLCSVRALTNPCCLCRARLDWTVRLARLGRGERRERRERAGGPASSSSQLRSWRAGDTR